jgi:thiamine biosynthesis lipoprotein
MGLPITVEVVRDDFRTEDIETVFKYLTTVDELFNIYKKSSEIARFNAGKLSRQQLSSDVRLILQLADDTKHETRGYFDIKKDGIIDPSGLVKGWAVYNASQLLTRKGYKNFSIDAGGDVQVMGTNAEGKPWAVGICNPYSQQEVIKVLRLANKGVATVGIHNIAQYQYDMVQARKDAATVASITVVGPNIYDADRFAAAAFAMGRHGIAFIEQMEGFEGYMINTNGTAFFTSNFD